MRKWLWVALTVLLAVGLAVQPRFAVWRDRTGRESTLLQVDAVTLQEHMEQYLESRWHGIKLNLQFAPDRTALVQAELARSQLCELMTLPDWIVHTLPEALCIDLQAGLGLDDNDDVAMRAVAFSINGVRMPQAVGDAVCAGVAYKINETLRTENVRLKSLCIEGDMLKLETK